MIGRQRMIDAVLGEDFMSGVRFSAPAKYYPGEVVGCSGKPWMGLADGETNTTWLSKYAMGSRRAIADDPLPPDRRRPVDHCFHATPPGGPHGARSNHRREGVVGRTHTFVVAAPQASQLHDFAHRSSQGKSHL
jgi:hypothetical protein